MRQDSRELVDRAWRAGLVIPAFNIAHAPMMEAVVAALADVGTFGFIQVARPDWEKFGAGGLAAIRALYEKVKDERFTRLHLDHVPVIDEDGEDVDFEALIREALDLGYESVMVDGSRLPLERNIEVTRRVVDMAQVAGVPVEAELGAVLGHEKGPLPPYEELFSSGRGFTRVDEAEEFMRSSGADWLSVAVGNIHGALSGAARDRKKVEARLNIDHLAALGEATKAPLVLHGGSGINRASLAEAFACGIAKINIGTAIRQVYEQGAAVSEADGARRVFEVTRRLCVEELGMADSASVIHGGAPAAARDNA